MSKVKPPPGQPYHTNEKGQRICGAKTRRGTPCASTAVMPNGRCRMHGGVHKSGPAHPRWKHGKYSKALPTRLLDDYEQQMSDPDLLTMRNEVALVDALIQDRLRTLAVGDSAALWIEATDKYQALRRALRTQDEQRATQLFDELNTLLQSGTENAHARRELLDLLERRRKLVESERRMLVDMGLMMSAAELLSAIRLIINILEEHVTDREIIARIWQDIDRRLLTSPAAGVAGPEPGRVGTYVLPG